jgi:hypothetical protein
MGRKLLMGCLILVGMVVPHTMFYLFLVLGIIAGEGPERRDERRV